MPPGKPRRIKIKNPINPALEISRPNPEYEDKPNSTTLATAPPSERAIDLGNGKTTRTGQPQGLNLTPAQIEEHIDRLNEIIPAPSRAHLETPQAILAHETRYLAWTAGLTWQEIADEEGVDYKVVRRSCFYFLLRVPPMEQIGIRNSHTISRAHNEHNDAYFQCLKDLFREKTWPARSAALKHFRQTIMPQSNTFTINVDNRKQSLTIGNSKLTSSFEQAMERVRRQHAELPTDRPEHLTLAEGSPSTEPERIVIEAELVTEDL